MKKWETPRMVIDEFQPNENVSACLQLACTIVGRDEYPQIYNNKEFNTHSREYCGQVTHQELQVNADGSLSVTEIRASNEANSGGLKTNRVTWTDIDNDGTPSAGDFVQWENSSFLSSAYGQEIIWHHKGTLGSVSTTRPNRS